MTLTLDPQTEQSLQRELARGHHAGVSEVINRALSLLAEEEEWLLVNKQALNERLDESYAQIARGEVVPGDTLKEMLAADRAAHGE